MELVHSGSNQALYVQGFRGKVLVPGTLCSGSGSTCFWASRIQGFGSGSSWIRINLSCWIRIRLNCGSGSRRANDPQKYKKSPEFMFWSTGCALLRAEGFSCSLGVLYGCLGISKLQLWSKKIEIKFPAINFIFIFCHQTLDPDPGSETLPGFTSQRYGSSVADPWHFSVDPDPRIHASDEWIRIWILLFSSLAFKMLTKLI